MCWRAEATREEKWMGGRLRRLRQKETIGVKAISSWETHWEVNKKVVRKVQRCDREGLCGTVSCENEI